MSTFFRFEYERSVSENFEKGNFEFEIVEPEKLASSTFIPVIDRFEKSSPGLSLFLNNFLRFSELSSTVEIEVFGFET